MPCWPCCLPLPLSQAGETPEKSKAVKQDDQGKYADKDGTPTYNVKPDGTVDWFTYAGFRLYHADCHVCHGPEGAGSSYAPALVELAQDHDLRAVSGCRGEWPDGRHVPQSKA